MEEMLLLVLLTLVASGVGTLTGFGTSTIMVPVLMLFYPLPVTLLFVGVIHFFGDIWKMGLFRQGLNWQMILGFGISGAPVISGLHFRLRCRRRCFSGYSAGLTLP